MVARTFSPSTPGADTGDRPALYALLYMANSMPAKVTS